MEERPTKAVTQDTLTRATRAAANIQSNKTQQILNPSQVPLERHQQIRSVILEGRIMMIADRNVIRKEEAHQGQGLQMTAETTEIGLTQRITAIATEEKEAKAMKEDDPARARKDELIAAEAEVIRSHLIGMNVEREGVILETERGEDAMILGHPQDQHQEIVSIKRRRKRAIERRAVDHLKKRKSAKSRLDWPKLDYLLLSKLTIEWEWKMILICQILTKIKNKLHLHLSNKLQKIQKLYRLMSKTSLNLTQIKSLYLLLK